MGRAQSARACVCVCVAGRHRLDKQKRPHFVRCSRRRTSKSEPLRRNSAQTRQYAVALVCISPEHATTIWKSVSWGCTRAHRCTWATQVDECQFRLPARSRADLIRFGSIRSDVTVALHKVNKLGRRQVDERLKDRRANPFSIFARSCRLPRLPGPQLFPIEGALPYCLSYFNHNQQSARVPVGRL